MEYAKASPNDILIRLRIDNRGPEPWTLHVLPTIWFRNVWSWGRTGEGYTPEPAIRQVDATHLACEHSSLGKFRFEAMTPPERFLFTENETNLERLYQASKRNAIREGRIPPLHRAWRERGGESEADTAPRRRVLSPGDSGGQRHRTAVPAERGERRRARSTFRRAFSRSACARRICSTAIDRPAHPPRHADCAAGVGEALLWSKQFYHFAVLRVAGGRSGLSRAAGRALERPEQRMDCISTIAT